MNFVPWLLFGMFLSGLFFCDAYFFHCKEDLSKKVKLFVSLFFSLYMMFFVTIALFVIFKEMSNINKELKELFSNRSEGSNCSIVEEELFSNRSEGSNCSIVEEELSPNRSEGSNCSIVEKELSSNRSEGSDRSVLGIQNMPSNCSIAEMQTMELCMKQDKVFIYLEQFRNNMSMKTSFLRETIKLFGNRCLYLIKLKQFYEINEKRLKRIQNRKLRSFKEGLNYISFLVDSWTEQIPPCLLSVFIFITPEEVAQEGRKVFIERLESINSCEVRYNSIAEKFEEVMCSMYKKIRYVNRVLNKIESSIFRTASTTEIRMNELNRKYMEVCIYSQEFIERINIEKSLLQNLIYSMDKNCSKIICSVDKAEKEQLYNLKNNELKLAQKELDGICQQEGTCWDEYLKFIMYPKKGEAWWITEISLIPFLKCVNVEPLRAEVFEKKLKLINDFKVKQDESCAALQQSIHDLLQQSYNIYGRIINIENKIKDKNTETESLLSLSLLDVQKYDYLTLEVQKMKLEMQKELVCIYCEELVGRINLQKKFLRSQVSTLCELFNRIFVESKDLIQEKEAFRMNYDKLQPVKRELNEISDKWKIFNDQHIKFCDFSTLIPFEESVKGKVFAEKLNSINCFQIEMFNIYESLEQSIYDIHGKIIDLNNRLTCMIKIIDRKNLVAYRNPNFILNLISKLQEYKNESDVEDESESDDEDKVILCKDIADFSSKTVNGEYPYTSSKYEKHQISNCQILEDQLTSFEDTQNFSNNATNHNSLKIECEIPLGRQLMQKILTRIQNITGMR